MLLVTGAALAQEPAPASEPAPAPKIWTDQAELGLVMTNGNTETQTFSFKNTLEGHWEKSSFKFHVGALNADSTETTRFAVGDPLNHDVEEISRSKTTAEAYELLARYERKFGKRHAWFTEAGWQRNEFAGFNDRYQLTTGLASTWKDGPRLHYTTDVGLSWTSQDDVVPKPGGSDSWLGLRLGHIFLAKVGKNGEYGNTLVIDENLDETSDLRIDMTNHFSVGFTKMLAMKVSHRLLYDGDPQLEEIPLFDPADLTVPIGKVTNDLDEVDQILTASLVVTF